MNYYRWVQKNLTGTRSKNKVRLIFGARQTGKTVLLKQLLPEHHLKLYNLQERQLRRRLEIDPSILSREIRALPESITHIAVDEIQKVPALLDEIQYLYDQDPFRYQFFLTGSSARKLKTHSANLLPGRCDIYHLFPVIRPEEREEKGQIPLPASQELPVFPSRNLFHRLIFGNLPGVRSEAPETAVETLDAYVENYLEEEIRREGLVRNLGAFQVFLRMAALESGNAVNLSNISQDSGIPCSTLKTFFQVLGDTFVGYWVYPYTRPGRKRMFKTPKFLFFDLGVRNASARLNPDDPFCPQAGGSLLEQWVGIELVQRAAYSGRGYEVAFWRTVSGAEVDYVWQGPGEDIPIEVKWTENPKRKDIRHLETFLDLYPGRSKRALLVCRAPQAQQISERVVAIPWTEL